MIAAAVIAILALTGFTAICLTFYIDARLNKCLASENSINAAFRQYAQHLRCQFDTHITEISRLEEKISKLDNNMAKLTIEVEADRLVEATKKAYNRQKNSISIP